MGENLIFDPSNQSDIFHIVLQFFHIVCLQNFLRVQLIFGLSLQCLYVVVDHFIQFLLVLVNKFFTELIMIHDAIIFES